MPFARFLFLFLAVLALTGCEDVIVVDLDDGTPPRVVVEGGVVHGATVHTIRLTTTSDYFADAEPPPVEGATVTISDDLGTVVFLRETAPGFYRTDALATAIGRTYTLDIEADVTITRPRPSSVPATASSVASQRARAASTLRA